MDNLQWYDGLRAFTAFFCLWSAWRLTKLVRKDHQTYTARLIDYIWCVYATLFTFFIAAVEAILTNSGYRYTTLLTFLILCVAVRATRDDRDPLQKPKEG